MSARSKPLAITMALAITAACMGVAASVPVSAAAPTWTTAFRDDFSGSGLPNPANWQLTLGTSYPGGPANFGTGEIQVMTDNPNNVNVRNGSMYITPQRDAAGGWTSARVETNRANFKPPAGGIMHVESRLQMPNVTGAAALGYWPAFWMLGSPNRANRWSWPGVGEFDIMENVQGLNWSYGVLHCGFWDATGNGPCHEPDGLNNGGAPCLVTTCQAGFHVYSMEWDSTGATDQLRWYIDGRETHSVNETDVTAQAWADLSTHAGYFIIFNVAMGGAFPNSRNLGGGPYAATRPGVPLVVDYVEVKYAAGQGTPTTPPPPPPTSQPTSPPPPTTTTTAPPVTTAPPATNQPTTGPSNLRVTGTTASTITIGWNGSATGSYDVLRSGQRIATVTGTSFTDQGLLPNTPYLYSISGGGITTPVLTATLGSTPTSASSPPASPPPATQTTAPPPAPGSPSNLRVASTTSSTITLGWDGPASASYEVLRSGIPIATVTTRGFTDIGLFPNTPYVYSIRGNGVTTPELTATIG
jgi:beta-glucanase (GH16 family)